MPHYVVLSNLTDEGRKTIKDNPGRILDVNKEIEAMGIKIVKQLAILGPYDFVTILDAPDNEAVMKLSVALGSRGLSRFHPAPRTRTPVGHECKSRR